MYPIFRLKFLTNMGSLFMLVLSLAIPALAQTYTPGTDITSQLNSAIASGSNGIAANQAIITLPAGVFYISSSVNLQDSILKGAGKTKTFLVFTTDLGAGAYGFTGKSSNNNYNYEIDDLAIQGNYVGAGHTASGVAPGTTPVQMDGIQLYSDAILRRVAVNYFNSGIYVSGYYHTFDTVDAIGNYNGVEYSNSANLNDYISNCNFTSNGFSGIAIDSNGNVNASVLIQTNLGSEPYGIYLNHNVTLWGCVFSATQFQNVGNADIADADATSLVTQNDFTDCGWGTYSAASALSGQATSPALRCGQFNDNLIHAAATQGPPPGNMSCSSKAYGNNWVADSATLSQITSGALSPITIGSVGAIYGNCVVAGSSDTIVLCSATTALTANEPVEKDNGRYVGVNPALGLNLVFGISLAPSVPVGGTAWVAQTGGPVAVACPTNSTITRNQFTKANSSSQAIPATGFTDGSNIGLATGAASGGIVNVLLNLPK